MKLGVIALLKRKKYKINNLTHFKKLAKIVNKHKVSRKCEIIIL